MEKWISWVEKHDFKLLQVIKRYQLHVVYIKML